MNEFSETPVKSSNPVRQFLGKVFDAMDPVPPVPKENITPQITAQRLLENMGNPIREKVLGENTYWDNPFSLRDVLAALGHVPLFTAQDHFDVFPQECQATGKALQELVNEGALQIVPQEKADRYNQRVYWRVIDEAKLKEIARGKPTAKP